MHAICMHATVAPLTLNCLLHCEKERNPRYDQAVIYDKNHL